MAQSTRVCKSCGARLQADDTACTLCGEPVAPAVPAQKDSHEPGTDVPSTDLPSPDEPVSESPETGLPAAAEVFEDLPAPAVDSTTAANQADVPASAKKSGLGAIVLMAGLLLVVGLYLISSISRSTPGDLEPEPTAIAELMEAEETEPLAASVVAEVSRIRDEARSLEGTARLDKLRDLAVLYQNHGRFDLAGDTQLEIAEESGMEIDLVRAGNLYYDWMETKQPPAKSVYARKAIAAYQRALEINPDNLDVRTDMAVAYLFDPENPMQAIINTNQVLQADSLHLQANFNRGIMLMQINRMEDALQQFKKVQRLAPDSTSPVHQRAAEAIRLIESRPAANVQ